MWLTQEVTNDALNFSYMKIYLFSSDLLVVVFKHYTKYEEITANIMLD